MNRIKLGWPLVFLGALCIACAIYLFVSPSAKRPGAHQSSPLQPIEANLVHAGIPRNDQEGIRPDEWEKPGTTWRLRVIQYSQVGALVASDSRARRQIPKVEHEWEMKIEVLEPRTVGNKKIGRLRFAPLGKLPAWMKDARSIAEFGRQYELDLEISTGRVEAFRPSAQLSATAVTSFGDFTFLSSDLWGFPVNWIAEKTDWRVVPQGKKSEVWYLDKEKHYKVEKTLQPIEVSVNAQGSADSRRPGIRIQLIKSSFGRINERVVQDWLPSEGWWRKFQRFDGEHIHLDAVLLER